MVRSQGINGTNDARMDIFDKSSDYELAQFLSTKELDPVANASTSGHIVTT